MELVHQLRALTVHLDLLGAAFAAAHRLHATDLRALIHLLDADRAGTVATPGWLGGQLGMNSAAVTALLDRLENAGHVQRTRDTTDRRRVRLQVSAEATALGWEFFGPQIASMVDAMRAFDAGELATAARFLRAMSDALGVPLR
jgi:DNA-binding MarR family transcriptional regulator